ncbi:hypothetical protein TTHERM_00129740 (macronuclear) [Tetrahymena thermophila SB210]|uniref:Uncharacterized protein n=1 Tax=Tetrahymena thermophila (strain SB210) TaxID=312017 RepID=I7MEE8_TETTS|nr:hypothetical protein TTHERM_00129740 [Tetrahymena thermophila SB210]EAR96197.1 hypothetical protein TTHERM_00129740 [Tetrahymena thermophila SB210]|eukprot:XP_001016442.1 hypothetical protein TTHERM_00129740 [Tetrahymena thermophila SB210]
MSRERNQLKSDNLPALNESKSKHYFFSPVKDFKQQKIQQIKQNQLSLSTDKTEFQSYLKAKYEKQIIKEQSMQNKNNNHINTMNTTMAQKIIDKIFINSPSKKITSQQMSQSMLDVQVLSQSTQNLGQKFTLKNMLFNHQICQIQNKNNFVSQLGVQSPFKSLKIQIKSGGEEELMKTKLKNGQWTSTVELQNLRSHGNLPSENVNKYVSPTKLKVSMPLMEEIQQINEEDRINKQKRNAATKLQKKQILELSKVNKKLEKIKHQKTNSLNFLPQNSYIQLAINSCQNICLNSQTNTAQTKPQPQKQQLIHQKESQINRNDNANSNNNDFSNCSSITNIPISNANNTGFNKINKQPSLDDIHFNCNNNSQKNEGKSFNIFTNSNTNTATNFLPGSDKNITNLISFENQSNLELNNFNLDDNQHSKQNNGHHQILQRFASLQQSSINSSLNHFNLKNNLRQNIINKEYSNLPQQSETIKFNLKNQKEIQRQSKEDEQKQNDQQKQNSFNNCLNISKEDFYNAQKQESSKQIQINSLIQIEPNSKSETLIEPLFQGKSNLNSIILEIPKKAGYSSMIQLEVHEEEIEETIEPKIQPKSMIINNLKNEFLQENSQISNRSYLNQSKDEIDTNKFKKSTDNNHQHLQKSKSNFIFFGKNNNSMQLQLNSQQSSQSNNPSNANTNIQEQIRRNLKQQLNVSSPLNNRKDILIQQIFLQNQKNKTHQSHHASHLQSPNSLQHHQSRPSPLRNHENLTPLNLNSITPNSTIKQNSNQQQQNPLSPLNLSPHSELMPTINNQQNLQEKYKINLDLIKQNNQSNNLLNQSDSVCSLDTPKIINTPLLTSNKQLLQTSTPTAFNRKRQASNIEITHNGGHHSSNQALLSQILKKNTKNFSLTRNNSTNNQQIVNNISSNSNNVNTNLRTLNSSLNSQFSLSSANVTPQNQQTRKNSIKTKFNQEQQNEYSKQSFSNFLQASSQQEQQIQNNIEQQESSAHKQRSSFQNNQNQLRFTIDELCQGLESYILKDVDFMKELKQSEIDSSSFTFYISKYLQLSQLDVQNSQNQKQKDKLVLFKINSQLFEKSRAILQKKMEDMNLDKPLQEKIIKLFEDSKQSILASNVFEEIGGKKQIRQFIQLIVSDIKENTNIPILNQFTDQKELLDSSTQFFSHLFKGEYEQVNILSQQFLSKSFNVTLIEYFLLKNYAYNSLRKDQTLIKEVILRILEKIESVRSCLVQNYDDNLVLNSDSRIQSLLFDLGIHSNPVHKFIKPLKNKILPESQYDPFSYYLKQEVKYLITNPKLRKMARMVEANLKSKDDFYIVSQNFLEILKKQKSIKFTANQLLNIEIRILKVAILLGIEESYLGLFKDISELESQLIEEIDQYNQLGNKKQSVQDMKQSLDIKFLCFVIEFTFNQYCVFNAYDISIAKKFYSLNEEIITIQISSLENLLLKRKKESKMFIQIQQKIPQFISLLKKILIHT